MTGEVTRPSYRPRVLIGVGRQQERRLMQALGNDRTLQVVGRYNSATELLSRVGQEDAEVIVLDDDLHLLDSDRLQNLTRRRRLAVVLLVHDRESVLRAARRYEHLDISGLTGISNAQRHALLALGAVDRVRAARESV